MLLNIAYDASCCFRFGSDDGTSPKIPFHEFCQNATIHEFRDYDHQVAVAGDTAVVTFLYDMIYERHGERYRSTGRDLWVFQNQGRAWIAVWRTMLDMEEKAVA